MKRDAYYDNVKAILIFLVVFGHMIQPLRAAFPALSNVYKVIYLFHIPLFAFVSGRFSKTSLDASEIRKFFSTLILPYLFFESVFSILMWALGDKEAFEWSLLKPFWIMWYLMSLFCWKLLLPFFCRMRVPVAIAVALFCGLGVGFSQYQENLSFARTFVFFPFFLAGNMIDPKLFLQKGRPASQWIGVIILTIVVALVFTLKKTGLTDKWLFGSISYASLGVDGVHGTVMRGVLYGIAAAMGLSVLALAPHTPKWFTHIGTRCMGVYLFHGLIFKSLVSTAFYSFLHGNLLLAFGVTLGLAFLLTFVFSRKPFAYFFDRLFNNEKILSLFLRKD